MRINGPRFGFWFWRFPSSCAGPLSDIGRSSPKLGDIVGRSLAGQMQVSQRPLKQVDVNVVVVVVFDEGGQRKRQLDAISAFFSQVDGMGLDPAQRFDKCWSYWGQIRKNLKRLVGVLASGFGEAWTYIGAQINFYMDTMKGRQRSN